MTKEYDVTLTITHVEANSEEEAIRIARASSYRVANSMGEAKEIEE